MNWEKLTKKVRLYVDKAGEEFTPDYAKGLTVEGAMEEGGKWHVWGRGYYNEDTGDISTSYRDSDYEYTTFQMWIPKEYSRVHVEGMNLKRTGFIEVPKWWDWRVYYGCPDWYKKYRNTETLLNFVEDVRKTIDKYSGEKLRGRLSKMKREFFSTLSGGVSKEEVKEMKRESKKKKLEEVT